LPTSKLSFYFLPLLRVCQTLGPIPILEFVQASNSTGGPVWEPAGARLFRGALARESAIVRGCDTVGRPWVASPSASSHVLPGEQLTLVLLYGTRRAPRRRTARRCQRCRQGRVQCRDHTSMAIRISQDYLDCVHGTLAVFSSTNYH